jgi:hypothetical protein
MPLLINGRSFLKSATHGDPNTDTYFVGVSSHELFHNFVGENLDWPSPLIKKYQEQGEAGIVLNHLHLMALQKAIYLKLGRTHELDELIANDAHIGPGYRRAWEIVNSVEGYQPFVSELQK